MQKTRFQLKRKIFYFMKATNLLQKPESPPKYSKPVKLKCELFSCVFTNSDSQIVFKADTYPEQRLHRFWMQ